MSMAPRIYLFHTMSGYTTKADLIGKLPDQWITEATDDNGDQSGVDAVLSAAIASAQRDIDGFLGQRYAVPFQDGAIPAIVRAASDAFTLYNLYLRRGVADDDNPHAATAAYWRAKLAAIGAGQEPLSPDHKRKIGAIRTVGSSAKAVSKYHFNS